MTRIAHIMTLHPAVVTSTTTAAEAGAIMVAARLRHLPVVDRGGELVGILSDRDLRGPIVGGGEQRPAPHADALVGSLMTHAVVTAGPDDELGAVARAMVERRVGAIPIVGDDRRPLGIVSFVDVLRRLALEAEEDARAVERID
jgi:CBS domain-containing protein